MHSYVRVMCDLRDGVRKKETVLVFRNTNRARGIVLATLGQIRVHLYSRFLIVCQQWSKNLCRYWYFL